MKKYLLTVFIFSSTLLAVTATQTDWSGGGGVPGPVTDWGNSYDTGDQIDHTGNTLCLMLNILEDPGQHTLNRSFTSARSVYAADVNGDGYIDVLGAAIIADKITWWENSDTAPGVIWIEHTIDGSYIGASSVYATDVDGDGDTDVLGATYSDNGITWWENTDGIGTVWTEYTVGGSFRGARSVYATDVDGDGDIDVLGAAETAGNITWWENTDGAGTVWTEHTVDDSFEGARSVYAADVDGDGDTDVLGAAFDADAITLWENTNGIGTLWTEHTMNPSLNGAYSVYAADVDGDGDTDVLGAARYDDDIFWWENSDTAPGVVWTEHTLDDSFEGAGSVFATDVDGDGYIDVLGAAIEAGDITWWENSDTAPGAVWAEHTVDNSFGDAHSIYAADVDGDGNTDVLGAGGDTIAWWPAFGYSRLGTLESSILEAGTVEHWNSFAFNGDEPAGTLLGFQFRSSQDYSSMGAWSDTVFASGTGLSGILADSTDFLQYRVILQTTDLSRTPVLGDVSFVYTTYLGIADNNTSSWGLAPGANPSFGNCAFQVSVLQPGMVDLVLYDITGRVVTRHSQELPVGTHAVSFSSLAEGIYICTMHAGDFTATQRVVVLKQE